MSIVVLVAATLAALLAATLATLLTFAHPMIPFVGLALAVSMVPFADVPVLPGGVVLVMCAWCWASLATGHVALRVPNAPIIAVAVLVLLSGLSMAGTADSMDAVTDFARWAIASSVAYPLWLLSAEQRDRVGRTFGYGATVAAAAGIALLAANPSGSWVAHVGLTGTDPNGNSRVVLNPGGASLSRLTSTYLDPNVGALLMSFGLLMVLSKTTGLRRVLCSVVLVMAIALTLSRAAMGSIAVGGLLLVVCSGLRWQSRLRLTLLGVVAGGWVLSLPGTMTRLKGSFGSTDIGSSQRWAAIVDLPHQMHGHWLLGRGWGLPELLYGNVARLSNYPANAPLLSTYRGGVFVGIAFTVLLVLLVVAGWRLLRHSDLPSAALGAGTIGIVLVAFQLDFPAVTIGPVVVLLAMLLAETAATDRR